jgi:hypothetical protein
MAFGVWNYPHGSTRQFNSKKYSKIRSLPGSAGGTVPSLAEKRFSPCAFSLYGGIRYSLFRNLFSNYTTDIFRCQ